MSSTDDRLDGIKDQVTGKVKEGYGKVTGDQEKEAEGKLDQLKGKVEKGVADVKDMAKDVVDKVKGEDS